MTLADARYLPNARVATIALATEGGRVPITEDPIAHLEATEAFSKVRVFLRKHGWGPTDERGDDDDRS